VTVNRLKSASQNSKAKSIMFTSILFLFFFVAFNRGTYLVLGLLFNGKREIPRNLAEFMQSGVPFLGSFQVDSDSLVVGRLKENLNDGLFSEWPFLGESGGYLSQIGLGGWLITLLPTTFRSQEAIGIAMMYSTAAAASALIAVWIVKGAFRTLSTWGAVLVALTLLQPWIVAIAGSIYWLIGLKLLPAIVLLRLSNYPNLPYRITLIGVASATFLALASGYEYVTVVFALTLSVITYNAIQREWSVRLYATRVMMTLSCQVASFVCTLIVHFGLLLPATGNFSSAFDVIRRIVSKRTGANSAPVDGVFMESLLVSPLEVLVTYLSMPVFGAPFNLPILNLFTVGNLILFCICAMPLLGRLESSCGLNHRALGFAWLVSLLGPMGWFLLARPHSYIHTHINYALWFLPTIPLAAVFLTELITRWIDRIKRERALSVAMIIFSAVLALMVVISFLARR
jgi:hypothetical protein